MASRNDITGDSLISKVNSDSFRDNFDRIFRSKKKESDNDGRSNTQDIHAGILQQDAALEADEANRTSEGSGVLVEDLICAQCNCITDDLYYGFCKRCFTK